jgi:prevent-host-death family protein
METTRVGLRELKSRLSEYLRLVKAGQMIEITERGKTIAHISPIPPTLEERMQALEDAGFLVRGKGRVKPHQPKIINHTERLMSDVVVEDRR